MKVEFHFNDFDKALGLCSRARAFSFLTIDSSHGHRSFYKVLAEAPGFRDRFQMEAYLKEIGVKDYCEEQEIFYSIYK